MKRCVNVDSGRPKLGERGLNLVLLQGSMRSFTKFVNVSVSIFDKMKEFIGVDFDFNLGTVYA